MSENSTPLKLNIGCGPDKRHDFINIDINPSWNPDLVCDVKSLPYPPDSVDEILASDILEHFSFRETVNVLENWYKVLKPCGQLIIKTPNIDTIIDSYQVKRIPIEEMVRKLYGNQDSENNVHYAGFNPSFLKTLLVSVGFKVVRIQEILDGGDWSNMAIRCQK